MQKFLASWLSPSAITRCTEEILTKLRIVKTVWTSACGISSPPKPNPISFCIDFSPLKQRGMQELLSPHSQYRASHCLSEFPASAHDSRCPCQLCRSTDYQGKVTTSIQDFWGEITVLQRQHFPF